MPRAAPYRGAMNGAARYVTDLVEACERYAERPALSSGPWVLTHSEVLSWTYRLAGALAGLGIGRGSGLACVSAGNSPRTLLVRLAAHILGARLTQVCVGPTTHALDHLLRDCAPSLVVHDTPVPPGPGARIGLAALLELAAAREALPVPVAARDGDVARVTYTGGTTGLPKGVVSTFAAMAARTATRTDSPAPTAPGRWCSCRWTRSPSAPAAAAWSSCGSVAAPRSCTPSTPGRSPRRAGGSGPRPRT